MDAQLHRATVVVGIDGSEDALRAVRWGASEAERSRIPLRLVIAFGLLVGDPHSGLHTEDRYRRAMLGRAHRYLAEAAVVAAQQERRIEVEQQVLTGHPVPVLCDESRHARVVVIGDRGLGRVEDCWPVPSRSGWRRTRTAPSSSCAVSSPPRGAARWWSGWRAPRPTRSRSRSRSTRPPPGTCRWWRSTPGRTRWPTP
ncbi:universal stress protein [Pseudonocardia sp.]|uniref:universal stress protein n=1 Tax=Pseudonocardia sp. TaxID=60912 RepID=UPI0025F48DAB|nr:universal stress protein [Pseudonocardia sp.]